uniref:Uncharacterized protein n=1 Tax=Varanus komodoensis TaxID=61221 RepID=A0A8D2J9Y3_VARKO
MGAPGQACLCTKGPPRWETPFPRRCAVELYRNERIPVIERELVSRLKTPFLNWHFSVRGTESGLSVLRHWEPQAFWGKGLPEKVAFSFAGLPPQECFGLLECMHSNIQMQTQIAQAQLSLLEDMRESMNVLLSRQERQSLELTGQPELRPTKGSTSSPRPIS